MISITLQVLRILAAACIAIFIGFYVFYFMVCIRFARIENRSTPSFLAAEELPTVTILIPTYNEAKVISQKIRNLKLLHFPKNKLEVVFVDGGSTDGTADLVASFAKTSDVPIKLLRESERTGFNNAVIDAFPSTNGAIICINGAETEYDAEALNLMINHFSDSHIGAVTGKLRIKNIQDGYAPKLETSYRGLYDLVRGAESNIDSPFDIKGEISAARREVLAHLVERPRLRRKGAIDTCISFQARMDDLKTIYEPKAVYYELSPRSMLDSFKQRSRRAVALIENMMTFKFMIFRRRYGYFGTLIMPSHFLMLMVLPSVLLLGSFALALLFAIDPSTRILIALLAAILLVVLMSREVQAFVKTQLALIFAIVGFFFKAETQKFERLSSARPQ